MSSLPVAVASPLPELSLTGPLPTGRVVVEASAGTGKTYALSALVVRAIAEGALTTPELLVVTFTRAAAAELRDRIRAALVEAERVLAGGDVPGNQSWMSVLSAGDDKSNAARRKRVADAVAAFDEATISTIHGFCQQALRQLGLRSGARVGSELGAGVDLVVGEVCRDLLLGQLCNPISPLFAEVDDVAATTLLERLVKVVRAVLGNPGALIEPDPATLKDPKPELLALATAWSDLVNSAVDLVAVRRDARRELGYDDLVTGLRDVVVGDNPDTPGDTDAARALAARYSMVLVDEFQDTDPVQWEIFNTAFTGTLITVGDPKQAIYRFRGADVYAYLQAVGAGKVTRLGLSTNYRSDRDLVAATNALISGIDLGDERIVATPVTANRQGPGAVSVGSPIEIRMVPSDPLLNDGTDYPSVGLVRRAIVSDLVDQVVALLSGATIRRSGERSTPVEPGDIAVLVPKHHHAELVVRALTRAGVPAVRTRTGSVFKTDAAAQFHLLLAALDRFTHAPTVRGAMLGVFLEQSAALIDPLGDRAEEVLGEIQRTCAKWTDMLGRMSFLAWYDIVRDESGLTTRLLGDLGGERMLTDLDHIAELLAAELSPNGNAPARVLQVLATAVSSASDADDTGPQMRRIDSDAAAVQVTTLHGSKGLQYPIVMLPFSHEAATSRGPSIYSEYVADNDPDRFTKRRRRIISLFSKPTWHGPQNHDKEKARTHRAAVEMRGDALRLLYVGLTRAEHRTIVWYASLPTKPGYTGNEKSALGHVLFDRDPATGAPQNTRPRLAFGPKGGPQPFIPEFLPDDDEARTLLDALSSHSGGLITHTTINPRVRPSSWTPSVAAAAATDLAVADTRGRTVADPTWGRWSFTGLTRTVAGAAAQPVSGGNDEGGAVEVAKAPVAAAASVAMPWAALAGGRHFGVFVHEVMERVDPMAADLRAHVREVVVRQLVRTRVPASVEQLVDGIVASIETPLGALASHRRLADIPISDRLAELTFDLPLLDTRTPVAAAAIGEVLLDTLAADDVVRPYAADLAAGRFSSSISGFLQGSIDAVLRVPGADGTPRFLVVDYKTNNLHRDHTGDPLAAYHPDRLIDGMVEHDYPLQALLYSVGLHRFLRLRLPGYEPAVHLGGIGYLFVRGMVGSATPLDADRPYGVFAWTPPADTVLELDRIFAVGRAA